MGDGGNCPTCGRLHKLLAGRIHHQFIMAQKIYAQYRETNGGEQKNPLILLAADRNCTVLLTPTRNSSSTRAGEGRPMRHC
jgi:hypothetical protein